MSLSNNLLYLLLLYAVLDDNKLSTTNGILLALGIMLFGYCRSVFNCCCRPNACNGTVTSAAAANQFQAANNIF